MLARLLTRQGRLEEAADEVRCGEAVADRTGDPVDRLLADSMTALVELHRGDLDEAFRRQSGVDAALAGMPGGMFEMAPIVGIGLEVWGMLAVRDDSRASSEYRRRLHDACKRAGSLIGPVPTIGSDVWLWRSELESARGRRGRARRLAGRSLASAQQHDMPYQEARARLALARYRDAAGRDRERSRARRLLDRIGVRPDSPGIRGWGLEER